MKSLFQGSIHLRLLLAASLVLTAFFGLTGLSLDRAFRYAAEEALKAKLQSSIYALLAAAVEDERGRMTLPDNLTDPRFNLPDSGLYAEVAGPRVGYQWRSASLVGRSLDFLQRVEPGHAHFQLYESEALGKMMSLNFGVIWEDYDGHEIPYILAVAESLQPHLEQIAAFRNTLFSWLGGAALLLLVVQAWVLGWGLRPLRAVAEELHNIESGRSDRLSGHYPRELQSLTQNINSLIRHAQARQQRYRDALSDLAHSLKTPLAILQGLADREGRQETETQHTLTDQVARMNQIVSHQLQRAAASGRAAWSKSLPVRPAVERIARTLDKVYVEKAMVWEVNLADDMGFQGDEGDLMEVLGNLMDNAWKYGRHRVRIRGRNADPEGFELHVEDDGKGIPAKQAREVIKRGHRMDQQQPGQGIGLTVAYEIISAYGGELKLGQSDLGGTDVTIIISNGRHNGAARPHKG
jgi:two-component system sensor histidine kinase PhoQ